MRIAITDSFPNLIHCAEREFVQRFVVAASRIGHDVVEVVTSTDIESCSPDFVLCMHEFTPKLTDYTTLGVMWSPPQFFRNDIYRNRTTRSYDGYLVGSEYVRQHLFDLEFPTNVAKPKSAFHFLPLAPARLLEPRDSRDPRSLSYVGVNWDGARHGEIITSLANSKDLTVYGPEASWKHLRTGYGGKPDFDGEQLLKKLSSHGIALCFHRDEHRRADTPSMRLFEATAAGCVIITDEIPYATRLLGESALYVDLEQPAKAVIKNIHNHLNWIRKNPERADELAREAHRILNQQNCLENLVVKTCEFAKEVESFKSAKAMEVKQYYIGTATQQVSCETQDADPSRPSTIVDIILRCGDRDIAYLNRAIKSIELQTVGPFRLLLIDYKRRPDIQEFARTQSTGKVQLKYLECIDSGLRSTSLWKGLSEISAPFFAVMDDDDAVMSDHYCHLLYSAMRNAGASFFYGGSVRIEEDGGFMPAPNFNGPLGKTIEESRELKFLDPFHLERLLKGDNYITSNAWIARSSLLSGSIMDDPHLKYAEDLYLLYMLMSKTEFVFTNHATAFWYWRSRSRNNSMFKVDSYEWRECMNRIRLRLGQLSFPRSATFTELLQMRQLLSDVGYSLGFSANATPGNIKRKYGPLKSLFTRVPGASALREALRRRRRLRRLRAQGSANGINRSDCLGESLRLAVTPGGTM